MCVHLRPLAPHHQDTGLNGGSYSPFPTLLSQQVAPNVLFSLRKLLAFLSFLCSYLFISSPLSSSHTLSRLLSLLLLSTFWLCLLLLLKLSYLSLFLKWLSALSHQFSGQQKDSYLHTKSHVGQNSPNTGQYWVNFMQFQWKEKTPKTIF